MVFRRSLLRGEHQTLRLRSHLLFLDQAYGVAVRITDHQCFLEAQFSLRFSGDRHNVRRNELCACFAQSIGGRLNIFGNQRRLPMPEINSFGIDGHRPTAWWRLVVEELDVWRLRDWHHWRDEARVIE